MALTDPVDVRLAFLLRAAVRFDLVEAGKMTLDQAFDAEFVSTFLEITDACPCHRAIDLHFDRVHREDREQSLRRWRWRRQ